MIQAIQDKLVEKKCKACEGGDPKLTADQYTSLLKQLDHWDIRQDEMIFKSFSFKNFHHTMSFVNAIAWMAQSEMHHPDLEMGYNYCLVRYTTHAIGGLSENDFICAAKVDMLYQMYRK